MITAPGPGLLRSDMIVCEPRPGLLETGGAPQIAFVRYNHYYELGLRNVNVTMLAGSLRVS